MGLTFVPLLILVLSSQRQEIKLKLIPLLGHRAKLLFLLCKFKGFPHLSLPSPSILTSHLPDIRERQEVFPVVFLCDDMLGRGNQWGKPHVRTRLLCTFPIFAISRAIPGPGCYQTSQHSRGTGYPALRHLFLELEMMCGSKSLLLAALMSVLLLHLCSKSEGRCCSFCQLRREELFIFL